MRSLRLTGDLHEGLGRNWLRDQVRDKLAFAFEDMGEQQVKNIARPVHAHRIRIDAAAAASVEPAPLPLPDKPSIAILPFQNMSGDPDQEYFADGMAEDIITALSWHNAHRQMAPGRVAEVRPAPKRL
jgi:adenylate cyclase